jgi:hypothetical protein
MWFIFVVNSPKNNNGSMLFRYEKAVQLKATLPLAKYTHRRCISLLLISSHLPLLALISVLKPRACYILYQCCKFELRIQRYPFDDQTVHLVG